MQRTTGPSYSGGCLCGGIRYRATGPATHLCFCHCHSCRRAAGAPAVPWATFARAQLAVTHGELTEYGSSEGVMRGFCSVCGSSLSYRHAARPSEIDVAIASLDEPEALRPEAHVWVQDKLSWVAIGDGLPQFAQVDGEHALLAPRKVRPGYGAVSVRLVVDDVAGLVRFIQQVFAAEGDYLPSRPAELRVGDSTIMVSASGPRPPSTGFLYVYVGDVDTSYLRALTLGARSLEAPADVPYGDRRSMIQDSWGNTWQIARYCGPVHVS